MNDKSGISAWTDASYYITLGLKTRLKTVIDFKDEPFEAVVKQPIWHENNAYSRCEWYITIHQHKERLSPIMLLMKHGCCVMIRTRRKVIWCAQHPTFPLHQRHALAKICKIMLMFLKEVSCAVYLSNNAVKHWHCKIVKYCNILK